MKQINYQFTDKWSGSIEKHGYTMIPNLLIENQYDFRLSPSEFNTICHLLSFKWSKDHPFPSLHTIAKHSGLSIDTIRKNIRRLEQKGILKRQFRKGETSMYSFQPLLERLNILATSKYSRRKRIPPSDNSPSNPYAKIHTKEDTFDKTNFRPNRSSNGLSKIGNYLPRKYGENNE